MESVGDRWRARLIHQHQSTSAGGDGEQLCGRGDTSLFARRSAKA